MFPSGRALQDAHLSPKKDLLNHLVKVSVKTTMCYRAFIHSLNLLCSYDFSAVLPGFIYVDINVLPKTVRLKLSPSSFFIAERGRMCQYFYT